MALIHTIRCDLKKTKETRPVIIHPASIPNDWIHYKTHIPNIRKTRIRNRVDELETQAGELLPAAQSFHERMN